MKYSSNLYWGMTLKAGDNRMRDALNRFVTHLPRVAIKQTEDVAEAFAELLRNGAPTWDGSASSLTIQNSIKVEAIKEGFGITMVNHGFFLDAMDAHAAPSGFGDTKNPVMKSWLEQKRPGYELPWIWVKSKPWIKDSIRESSAAMRKAAKNGELAKFLKSLGHGGGLK